MRGFTRFGVRFGGVCIAWSCLGVCFGQFVVDMSHCSSPDRLFGTFWTNRKPWTHLYTVAVKQSVPASPQNVEKADEPWGASFPRIVKTFLRTSWTLGGASLGGFPGEA